MKPEAEIKQVSVVKNRDLEISKSLNLNNKGSNLKIDYELITR